MGCNLSAVRPTTDDRMSLLTAVRTTTAVVKVVCLGHIHSSTCTECLTNERGTYAAGLVLLRCKRTFVQGNKHNINDFLQPFTAGLP